MRKCRECGIMTIAIPLFCCYVSNELAALVRWLSCPIVWEKFFSLLAIKAYWGMDYNCTDYKLGVRLMRVNFISRPLCPWEKEPSVPIRRLAVVWLMAVQLLEFVDTVCVCAQYCS